MLCKFEKQIDSLIKIKYSNLKLLHLNQSPSRRWKVCYCLGDSYQDSPFSLPELVCVFKNDPAQMINDQILPQDLYYITNRCSAVTCMENLLDSHLNNWGDRYEEMFDKTLTPGAHL